MMRSADDLIRRLVARAAPMRPVPAGVAPRLAPMPGVRAVLFDVYGTLFLSGTGDIGIMPEVARGPAMTAALRAAGFPGAPDELGRHAADRMLELIRSDHERARRAGADVPEVDILRLWDSLLAEEAAAGRLPFAAPGQAAALAVEYEARVNPAWPMPGLAETVEGLRAAGRRLGIVSNAQFYTPLLFDALTGRSLADWGFEPDLCAWSWKAGEAKPSDRLFEPLLDALRRRGLASAETLVVGNDRLNDCAPAARLGLRTALFAGDRRSYRPRAGDPRCEDVRPDLVLTELTQLLQVLR